MLTKEWQTVALGKVATLQRGYDLPHRERRPGSIPIVTSSGIADTHAESRVAGPGVVTGRYGTIGEVFFIEQDFWPLNTTLFVKDFHGNDPLFVSYLLRTIDFHSHSGKSGVPGVNRNDLHGLEVSRPLLPEQRAIAGALGDMDALLGALQKLMAKKRDLKQAAMQQLLTGKQRLPGFSGEWEVKTIGDIFDVTAGGDVDPTRSNIEKDERHCFPIYSNALTAFGLYGYCTYNDHQAGSITVTARGTLGVANYRNHDFTAIGRVLVLHPKSELDGRFFTEVINNQIDFVVESTGVPQLTAPQISKHKVPVPSTPEQTAIAAVISDMNAELAALEARLAKTRALKQGMMQELLTGKTRLV